MLQHVEQDCQPRGVLRCLGRDIAHAARRAARAQLTLDLVVKAYPLGTRLRRQIEHRQLEAAVGGALHAAHFRESGHLAVER